MIIELGHFALVLALFAAILQSVLPLWGAAKNNHPAMHFADRAAQIQFLGIGGAFAALTYAYVVSDFSLMNVALNSHSSKPMLYKVSGVWANHEGSMLLWVFILALFGILISLFGKAMPISMRATVLSIQAMIGVAFLTFILFTSNPFERLDMVPLDGQGMNPLLQDPGVAFHPPLLYLGYVGFSTAFSFAVAALIRGQVDPSWARWMRPWILLAWSGLTAGIALGSWWAYYELGWGGFWFWDPVENASFMPWLLGTALMHSAIVVEKRSSLLAWTILLAIMSFALSLIGTFLVRSGVLNSVHAFANDPERGAYILLILVIAVGGALSLYVWRAPKLKDEGTFELFSREGGLLINNLLLSVSTLVVFVGTLYPLGLELFTGDKITVGAPYFNKSFIPIYALCVMFAAVGPFLSWKRASARRMLNPTYLALALTIATAVILLLVHGWPGPVGAFGIFIALFLILATLVEFARRIGLGKENAAAVRGRMFGLPRSAWGLYLGHIGLAIAAAGVVAASLWKAEEIHVVKLGEPVTVGPYQFVLHEVTNAKGPNYQTSIARVTVEQDGTVITELKPERRWYPVERKPTTEAGIETRWHGDFYAVLGDPARTKGQFVTRFYYNPGVPWMWLGAALMSLSGLISLTDRRLRVGVPSAKRKSALQPAE